MEAGGETPPKGIQKEGPGGGGGICRVAEGHPHSQAPVLTHSITVVPCVGLIPSEMSVVAPTPTMDALEGKGPQRRPQKRVGQRLEEVAKAVGGGYCRVRMPLSLAPAARDLQCTCRTLGAHGQWPGRGWAPWSTGGVKISRQVKFAVVNSVVGNFAEPPGRVYHPPPESTVCTAGVRETRGEP